MQNSDVCLGTGFKVVGHIPSTLEILCVYGGSPLCVFVCFCLQRSATRPTLDVVTQQIFTADLETVPERTVHHSMDASWTTSFAKNKVETHHRLCQWQLHAELQFNDQKDICMWVSLVARLGYCSTHGLRNVTGWTLSSPNRPLSMVPGGILSSNRSPRTGCPPWHQPPFFRNSGGL